MLAAVFLGIRNKPEPRARGVLRLLPAGEKIGVRGRGEAA
jgi:hypothetical protein